MKEIKQDSGAKTAKAEAESIKRILRISYHILCVTAVLITVISVGIIGFVLGWW